MAAARRCFIGQSSSTRASITSAAGDVDRPSTAVRCANVLVLSISCCLLWIRVSLLFHFHCVRFKWHAYKRGVCSFRDSYILPSFGHPCFVTHNFCPFAEWRHELSGVSHHLDQRLSVARPSSNDRCSPPCRSISSSNRKGEATS